MLAAVVLVACVLALGGCASAPAPEQTVPQQAPPTVVVEPAPAAPAPAAPPAPQPPNPDYAVSKEVYNRTFDEIRAVITELNTHIARGEYDGWLEHLTDNYVHETSKQEYLDKWKEDPELKQRGIVLRSLHDFFAYRVVPTRSRAELDEIQFVDDSHVYAYTVLRGEKYLLYYLVKTDKGWKVDFY